MTVNIMDGLVRFKPGNVEIEPALAEKWNISSDNLVYTFNLRSGVKFHDGTPFNADAVVTYFNSFLDKTSPYYIDGKFVYTDDTYGNFINRVEKVDDATVKITLKQVYAPFLANLALASGGILSPDALKKYGNDIGTNPVGTGPFKLSTAANWVRDNQLTLDANPDHWRGRPALDKVVFRIVPRVRCVWKPSRRRFAYRLGSYPKGHSGRCERSNPQCIGTARPEYV
jgi:peptide/nickel transport system substrate-binding protein